MDTDGRQTEPGGRESLADNNVVRLPRDWLGPRDELIPFGPSASEPEAGNDGRTGVPTTADAFWGESSGLLQDAMPAPPDAWPARPPTRRADARAAVRGRAGMISMLGAAAVIVGITLALVLAGTGAHSSGVRRLVASSAARPSAVTDSAAQAGRADSVRALARPHRGPARSATFLRRSQRVAGRRAARGGSSRLEVHVTPRTPTGTVQRVRYTRTSPPADTSSGTTSPAPPSSAPAPAPAPPPTATVSGGTGGRALSSGSQPALGANGALGPGSSPDG